MALSAIPLPDGDLAFDPTWLDAGPADALFAALSAGIAWQVHRIRMFGREVDSPRRSCWIGDPGASYRYSGTRFEPHPWPTVLLTLRVRLRAELGVDFNSVLANLYRDGGDRMGWHSDDEPELGPRPCIASVSLGATRRFLLKRRDGGGRLTLELPHGSLLLMRGDTQRRYRHALARTTRPVGPRINLTFRRIAIGG
ncbi:alpha-ketoglutarate-dependent dioxygenase AlkB [Luteimonas sp. SJ-92]|uniref:Alpha-ketoglutarate-dependent dioxygenase AlkB n=1 Tax=Luteimonas salinisoli TaxID=2752307 RepID=A0A853J868_9GAMM|nr:alpha-ketoglutarate-dependent dioxygenase AlkB [Luteimonas salinisoli]NZA25303.1 alpha-ketoglutarate-dependent dioxygenase AlkB [Luteimonas salinisoli]